MKALHMIASILLWVGGINWGLIGLSMLINGDGNAWNVVGLLLGGWPQVEAVVYVLVGISAVWLLVTHRKHCKECSSAGM